MISDEDLRAILEDAVWAPSGDNVQPWRFTISDDILHVINDANADVSLYNFKQRASLMSIGALLTNIDLASQERGYKTVTRFFPRGETNECVADVRFEQVSPSHSAMYEAIRDRCSNRKKYNGQALSGEQRHLFEPFNADARIQLRYIEDARITTVAKACSINEKIVLENRSMHDFLFTHVTWTIREDEKHPGFFIDTLELTSPQRAVFHLHAHWPFARILNFLGLAQLVANDNAKIYASSSAMLVLCSSDDDPATYVKAGMLLQELWLKATQLGVAVQLMAGTCLLGRAANDPTAHGLSAAHSSILRKAYIQIREAFELQQNEHALIVLRVGVADTPSGRTRRVKVAYNRE